MRVAVQIELYDVERAAPVKWSRGRSKPARLVLRAKNVLAAAEGRENEDIALDLGCKRETVGRWLNLIRRWFGGRTREQLRRGAFKSVDQLKSAIRSFVDQHNAYPQGFVWTITAQQLLTKVDRARRSVEAWDKPPSV